MFKFLFWITQHFMVVENAPAADTATPGGGESQTPTAKPDAADTSGEPSPALKEGEQKPQEGPKLMIEAIFGAGGEGNVGDGLKPKEDEKPPEGAVDGAVPEVKPELDKDGQPITKEADKKPAPKVDDKELYKTPEGLNKRSEKRFTQLVEVTKARTTERDQFAAEREEFKEKYTQSNQILSDFNSTLKDAGIGAPEMQAYVAYSSAIKAGNFTLATQMVKHQIRELTIASGHPFALDDVDPLSEFPDLQKEVGEFKITAERGLELARSRKREQANYQAGTEVVVQQQQLEKAREVVKSSLSKVDTFLAAQAKKDIDFKVKEAKILAKVEHIVATYPPEKWATIVKDLYESIEIVHPVDAPKPGEQPLKDGGKPLTKMAPKSMFEAMFPNG